MNTTLNKANAIIQEQPRHQLGGPPQPGVLLWAKITQINVDTLVVKFDDESESESTLEVLKPSKVCPGMDQDVDGYTYEYTSDDGQARTSTAGQSVESQVVVPAFIVDDLVQIGPAPGNLATFVPGLASYTRQVVNHPAMWDQVSTGSSGGDE